jgi:hypothetical protein
MRGGLTAAAPQAPAAYLGRRVWKRFHDGFYLGEVLSTCRMPRVGRVWRVHYLADDDSEDVSWPELRRILLPAKAGPLPATQRRGGPPAPRGGQDADRATPSAREDTACAQPAALKREEPAAAAAGAPGAAAAPGKRKRVAQSESPSGTPPGAHAAHGAHGGSPDAPWRQDSGAADAGGRQDGACGAARPPLTLHSFIRGLQPPLAHAERALAALARSGVTLAHLAQLGRLVAGAVEGDAAVTRALRFAAADCAALRAPAEQRALRRAVAALPARLAGS